MSRDRRYHVSDAEWDGVVETLQLSVEQSASMCGIPINVTKQMRQILRGQRGFTPKLKPPPDIVAQIPYPPELALNPDVRATAAREVTAEANAANRINEVAPVVTRKRPSKMTEDALIQIAKTMAWSAHSAARALGISHMMLLRWRSILRGENRPGVLQAKQVSAAVIRRIQEDFVTIPMVVNAPSAAPRSVAPAPKPDQPVSDPVDEVKAIVDQLVALAERVEKLVPIYEHASDASKKLAAGRAALAE